MLSIALATFALLAPPVPQQAADSPATARGSAGIEIGRGLGQLHPDLELPTIDGESTLRLSELRGRKLLLIEFASW